MLVEKKLLLIGGGGHCKSIVDSLLSSCMYHKIGIIDNYSSSIVSGVPVIGTDNDLPELFNNGWTDAFISVGSIGYTALRRKLYNMVKKIGFNVPTIIDTSAVVALDVAIKEGVFIGKRAIVNTGARIGECAILNSGSIVEHDCIIGAFSHVCPGTVLCGQVVVGEDSHVGAGAIVRQGISIGNRVLIGIASSVVNNLPDDVKAYGNPCRVVK